MPGGSLRPLAAPRRLSWNRWVFRRDRPRGASLFEDRRLLGFAIRALQVVLLVVSAYLAYGTVSPLVGAASLPRPRLPDVAAPAETTPDLKVAKWGTIWVESEETGQTSRKEIWAAGDNVRGADLVVTAVAAARKAATDIDQHLQERPPKKTLSS